MFKKVPLKVKDKLQSLLHKDVRWFVGVGAIIVSCVLCLTLYKVCNQRLTTAMMDFGVSFAFYFLHLLKIRDVINPTVNNMPDLDIQTYLPFSIEEVARKIKEFPRLFFDADNFRRYLVWLLENLRELYLVLMLLLLVFIIIFYIVFDGYATEQKEVKKDTRFERFVNKTRALYAKFVKFLKWFFGYYKDNAWIWKTLLFVWLVNTNIFTIFFEFFAYYFYFVCTFKIATLGTQVSKLVYDVIILLWSLPLIIWAFIGYVLFDVWRHDYAYKELCHMERRNRGYINTLPFVILLVGPMGVGKTMTAVDIVLSLQNELRDRALKLMHRNMLRFPEFNFQGFEADLREAIKKRIVKNLYTAREYVKELRIKYERESVPQNIWGYDAEKYPHRYNNGIMLLSIWEVLEFYAQEFFVYSLLTSSIISNIAVRSNVRVISKGYFERFNADFFKRKAEDYEKESSFSHIIDWDLFRIGCQINKKNKKAGSFEFGVILASEIGKERQNTLELRETKKNSDEANQKNDCFNAWLKVIRHNATIEYECFAYFVADEQRPESWGADARDLAAVIHIESKSEEKYTLHFTILPLIVAFLRKPYDSWYDDVKEYGNENVYVVSFLNLCMGKLFQIVERMQNRYGYKTSMLGSEMGTAVSSGSGGKELELHKYFMMNKKIYGAYSTDGFKGLFSKRMRESGTCIYEIPTYRNVVADLDEFDKQESYQMRQYKAFFDN